MTERRYNYLFKDKQMTEEIIIDALKKVAALYGKENAIKVEALFRNETKHFTSGNFLICYSPGMEATKDVMPYGWSSLAQFWKDKPEYAPIGIHKQVENDSRMMQSRGERKFIKFPSLEAAMMTVAKRLSDKDWYTGAWASNNADSQKKYADYLLKISTPLTKKI